ncbi:phosphopantetheine-binding protein [Kineococcus glutinatus]|uniref:Carrier domain-containing protein n=1 Tax=Kineococcus glutinatus TaxID=1070872 RepID=A0ABP9HYU8_9ACTN
MATPLSAEQLRTDVAELLATAPSEIGDDDDLLDHGLDSVRLMMLVERWRAAGVETDFAGLAEEPTLGGWRRRLLG